jgi:HAD superfamily hydrolase (TIGR01509 family)
MTAMTLEHIGLEVQDLYRMELFYRRAFGFTPIYRYVSRNTPGLRTVFLTNGQLRIELLERPRASSFQERRSAPNHLALSVDDVDACHRRLVALGLPEISVTAPRDTGDGFREVEVRDPEGNVVEISKRVGPETWYPVRAVIFDLDGTLVDSEENYYLADKELLARYGIDFSEDDKKRYIGGGNLDMMVDLKKRFDLSESADELAERKNALYLELAAHTRVYPKMKLLLEKLRARGVPLAVASGSAPLVLERILEWTGLAPNFAVVVSAEEVARGKPAPDIFLETARRLGVAAHECAVVEDSRAGVEAANRAFMRTIAVPYLTDKPLADAFTMADLLFEDGMAQFDPEATCRWLEPSFADGRSDRSSALEAERAHVTGGSP